MSLPSPSSSTTRQGAYGIDVSARFDPSVVDVIDADDAQAGVQVLSGAFLQPDFVVRNTADNASGALHYAITQINPSPPASGDGVIVTIAFRGKGAGAQSAFTIENVVLASRDGATLPVVMQHGTITVLAAGSVTPAPTSTARPSATYTPTAALPTATNTPLPAVMTPTNPPLPPMPARTNIPLPAATVAATRTPSPSPTTTTTVAARPTESPTRPAAVGVTAVAPSATATATSTSGDAPARADGGSQSVALTATATARPAQAIGQSAAAPTQSIAQPTARRYDPPLPMLAPAAPQRRSLLGMDMSTVFGAILIAGGITMLAALAYVSRQR